MYHKDDSAEPSFGRIGKFIFLRARVCWPLLWLCRPFCPFCIWERCLDSNPEAQSDLQNTLDFRVITLEAFFGLRNKC